MLSREELLKQEYENKLNSLYREQAACRHKWGPVEYDPEEYYEATGYETRWQGVDPYYVPTGHTKKTKDRWSRTCKICGKKEYTTEQVAVKYEPVFK